MITSPIVYIELLTVGRRRRYFLARVVYALVLLVVMAFCYLAAFPQYREATLRDQSQFAYTFFSAYSWVQQIVVLCLTPAMIAGTISVEHERKTIDYLLTTQLSDSEIALGKFAARLWSVIMQLVVGLPILAIALTLGGVSPGQMLASFGVSLFVLLFTATLSLAISSRAARSREAITRTYLVIIALLAFPPMAWGLSTMLFREVHGMPFWGDAAQGLNEAIGWLMQFHPFVFLTATLVGAAIQQTILPYGTFAAGYTVASALLAFSAVIGVRRFYLKQAGRSATAAKRGSWREWFQRKRRPVGERAMIWKEITSLRSAINLGWSGKIASALLIFMIVYFIGYGVVESVYDTGWRSSEWRNGRSPMEDVAMVEVPLIFGLMLLLITSNAAGSITGERERDTWITLMSTPVEGREIVRAKIWATLYGVRYWYALILITWGMCAVFRPGVLLILPVLITVHLICALFAAALGVRCSLQATTSLKSMGLALAIMVLGVSIAPLMATGFMGLAAREVEIMALFVPSSLPVMFSAIHPMLVSMFTDSRSSNNLGETLFIVGTVFSAMIYGGAAYWLYYNSIDAFDRLAGRSTWRSAGARPGSPRLEYAERYPAVPLKPMRRPEPVEVDVLELVDEAPTSGDAPPSHGAPNNGASEASRPEPR